MKMYIQHPWTGYDWDLPGFLLLAADYSFRDKPDGELYNQQAWTIEIDTLDDLLRLTKQVGGIALDVDPPDNAPPERQKIPTIRVGYDATYKL